MPEFAVTYQKISVNIEPFIRKIIAKLQSILAIVDKRVVQIILDYSVKTTVIKDLQQTCIKRPLKKRQNKYLAMVA